MYTTHTMLAELSVIDTLISMQGLRFIRPGQDFPCPVLPWTPPPPLHASRFSLMLVVPAVHIGLNGRASQQGT